MNYFLSSFELLSFQFNCLDIFALEYRKIKHPFLYIFNNFKESSSLFISCLILKSRHIHSIVNKKAWHIFFWWRKNPKITQCLIETFFLVYFSVVVSISIINILWMHWPVCKQECCIIEKPITERIIVIFKHTLQIFIKSPLLPINNYQKAINSLHFFKFFNHLFNVPFISALWITKTRCVNKHKWRFIRLSLPVNNMGRGFKSLWFKGRRAFKSIAIATQRLAWSTFTCTSSSYHNQPW